MSRIVVVGSLNMDLIMHTPRLPVLGETLLGGPFGDAYGGKGANQSVACARMGAEVVHIGRVGEDAYGGRLKEALRLEGVDVRGIYGTSQDPTGVAVITLVKGDNSIIVAPGANSRLLPEDLENSRNLLEGASMLLAQLEVPVSAVMAAFRMARKMGIATVLNPAPWTKLPEEIYSLVDVFVPNRIELAQASGSEDVASGAKRILERGVPSVVVTLGEEGAAYFTRESSGKVPSFPVSVVDTTGAGDTFTGALGVALSEEKPLEEAVRFACCAGALACEILGAQPSIPRRNEVEALLGRG
ncbi:MAG TPA: ribokinase [Synergistaceae bacterium]|nr:ribokinase [Synergistaceae bacterium]HPJ26427.1 ribokinase [Synergistaceae bacterium]HPQ36866.1 ribokinase [Synergistaceae bacterium]